MNPRRALASLARWRLGRRFVPDALTRAVRVLVIGTGKAGSYHLDALARIDGVTVVGLVNAGRSDPAPLQRRHGIAAAFTDLERAIEQCKPDAAIVAVPPAANPAIGRTLAERGIPFLLEKPLAHDVDAAEALVAHVRERGVLAAVGYNRRFYPNIEAARSAIAAFGRPTAIHVDAPEPLYEHRRRPDFAADAFRNRLLDNTTHAIDLLAHLGGPHDRVAGLGASPVEDGVATRYMALVRFADGGGGTFVSHWASPGAWRLELFGNGWRFSAGLRDSTSFTLDGPRPLDIPGPTPCDLLFKAGVYRQDLCFLRSLDAGVPSHPLATLDDALATLRLAAAIRAASES